MKITYIKTIEWFLDGNIPLADFLKKYVYIQWLCLLKKNDIHGGGSNSLQKVPEAIRNIPCYKLESDFQVAYTVVDHILCINTVQSIVLV